MTMEKRGVISESTPGGCCGGSCHENEKTATSSQQKTLPFSDLEPQPSAAERGREPDTEKQADDMQDSLLNSAIDAVHEETDGPSN